MTMMETFTDPYAYGGEPNDEQLAAFVAKLEEYTREAHQEFGQPVVFHGEGTREHMSTMLALPFGTHRDADTLARSNWRVISEDLTGRFPETVEAHRFGHWAVGWLERLYVRRDAREAIAAAYEWTNRLEAYPVADESDLAEIEWEEIDASIGDWLVYDVEPGAGQYSDPLYEWWKDELDNGQREDILRYVLAYDSAHDGRVDYPEHDGTDIRWDMDALNEVLTEWLVWATDPERPAPPPQTETLF